MSDTRPGEHLAAVECQRAGRARDLGTISQTNGSNGSAARHASVPLARCDGVQSRAAQGKENVRQRFTDQTAGGTADDDQLVRDDRAELHELMGLTRYGPAKAGHYVLTAFAFSVGFTVVAAAQSTESPSKTTVWQGVYTEAQATRGQSEYTAHCANCHRDDLSGYKIGRAHV